MDKIVMETTTKDTIVSSPAPETNLIDVVGLRKYFPIRAGLLKRTVGNVRAVDDVTFYIKRRETLGVVGESGCGKTTVGRSIMMLTTPTKGFVFFETPKDIVSDFRELEALRTISKEGEVSEQDLLRIVELIDLLLNRPSCRIKKDKKKQLCNEAKRLKQSLSRSIEMDSREGWTKRELSLVGILIIAAATMAFSWESFLSQDFLVDMATRLTFGGILLTEAVAALALALWPSTVRKHGVIDIADETIEEIANEYCINYMKRKDVRKMRGRIQFVFQDPFSSLDPRMLIKNIIAEPIKVQMKYWKTGDMEHKRESEGNKKKMKGEDQRQYIVKLLEKVGLNVEHMYRYPHEFSGGQRQRIGIARALSVKPDFVVLDEPTSALDVSVQAQILNNLNDLQRDFGLTYMFISHDLSTIRYMCDRVAVMYLGKIVEASPKAGLFAHPTHPYTEALLSVIPVPDPDIRKDRIILTGDVPSPANPPSGCRFHTRCQFAIQICSEKEPPLVDYGDEHFVACHVRKEIVK